MGNFFIIPILVIGLVILISSFFVVKQQTAAIIERFGKFQSIRQSGLQLKIPLIDKVAGRLSLKIQQLDVIIETKTLDDVFVRLKVSVQYRVISEKVYDAFYKLDYPHEQITSYVFDVVRAEVPKMKLDDVFVKKDDIALAVKAELNDAMLDYGFDIIKTLVTDIDPDAQVKEAMNRINAAEREKTAAQFEGDAARILIVEKAKAEAESKRLQGQGIADQRREIARGLEESVDVLNRVGINSQEASALIVVTQHYDTLQAVGQETNSNLILLPNSPQAGSQMLNDMVASFTASNQIGEAMKNSKKRMLMMKNNLKNTFICLLITASFNLFAQTKTDALRDAQLTSTASLKMDFETVLKFTLPSVLDMMGGKEAALKVISSTFEGMKSQGFVFEKADINGVSDIVKEQGQFRCVVEGYNQMIMSNQRISSKSYLLGIYNETDKHWWFIEAKQLKNEALTNQILPNFETALEIPDDDLKVEPITD